eukprot:NODE_355_length_8917_cov_1.682581.p8 type:complete len:169 gc:universal NODE_355_length_8917_cov_1.682581:2518-3024(+)
MSKNTGVKGVLEDYRLFKEEERKNYLLEAEMAIKQSKSLSVAQEDYTFSTKKEIYFNPKEFIYVDDEQYLFHVENDHNYLFLIMDPENDQQFVCNILSTITKKYNVQCIVYNSELIEDKSVTPMLMRNNAFLPCFLKNDMHQIHEKEDLLNIIDNSEQLMFHYKILYD